MRLSVWILVACFVFLKGVSESQDKKLDQPGTFSKPYTTHFFLYTFRQLDAETLPKYMKAVFEYQLEVFKNSSFGGDLDTEQNIRLYLLGNYTPKYNAQAEGYVVRKLIPISHLELQEYLKSKLDLPPVKVGSIYHTQTPGEEYGDYLVLMGTLTVKLKQKWSDIPLDIKIMILRETLTEFIEVDKWDPAIIQVKPKDLETDVLWVAMKMRICVKFVEWVEPNLLCPVKLYNK